MNENAKSENYNSSQNQTDNSSEYRVGIDIGGTTATVAIVSTKGHILGQATTHTRDYKTPEDFTTALAGLIVDLKKDLPEGTRLIGVGIGAPCANSSTGEIEAATELPWPSPIPLRRLMEERTGLPVAIANDANAAAAGEMLFGNARGMRNFIVITLGTGVGAGIVCDGHLLNGVRGFAGELGHVTINRHSKRLCNCGRYGCLQNYCSASGVVTTAKQLLSENPDAESILRDATELTSKSIYDAAVKGDKLAIETFRITGEWLGFACAQYAAFTDPDAFIIFGGVSRAGRLIFEPMEKAFEENTLHLYKNRVKFLPAGLPGADAAVLGAAALIG